MKTKIKKKPIISIDFDGVLHSYTSGWKGASVIPDPPVPNALEFIVTSLDHFEVAIFSSRSHQWGGKRAMKRWLRHHLYLLALQDYGHTPEWLLKRICKSCFAPWYYEVDCAIELIIKEIQWPWFKPPALISLDDRAICFTGEFPTISEMKDFIPWNKKPV